MLTYVVKGACRNCCYSRARTKINALTVCALRVFRPFRSQDMDDL
jgi:hypothetical protein